MVRLNLSSDDARNNYVRYRMRKNQSSVWHINKGFYLKNPKNPKSLKKCIKNETSKNSESIRKVSQI